MGRWDEEETAIKVFSVAVGQMALVDANKNDVRLQNQIDESMTKAKTVHSMTSWAGGGLER